MMRNAANLWRWIWVLNAGLLIVFAKPLYADSDDSLPATNSELYDWFRTGIWNQYDPLILFGSSPRTVM